MRYHVYELIWQVETDTLGFLYREFKVFSSKTEAKHYGGRREADLNGEAPIQERAHDGYYFKYINSFRIKEIDGFIAKLAQ